MVGSYMNLYILPGKLCHIVFFVDSHTPVTLRQSRRLTQTQLKSTGGNRVYIHVPIWEQLATDQPDQWQVIPRQVFTPYA